MNTKALITSGGSRKGLLLIAERLGALLTDDGTLQDLAKGLTGTLPEYRDDYAWGIRDALLEMLCSAEANRLNRTRPAEEELTAALKAAQEVLDGKSLCAGPECKMHCGLGQMHGCESVKAYLKENGGDVD